TRRNPVYLRRRRDRTSLSRAVLVWPSDVVSRTAAGFPGDPGTYAMSATGSFRPKRAASWAPVRSRGVHAWFGDAASHGSSTETRYGRSRPKASSELIVLPPLEEKERVCARAPSYVRICAQVSRA